MLLLITVLFSVWTLVYVYQGGKEINDHVVSIFVLACMSVFPFWGWLYKLEHGQGMHLFDFLLVLGPFSMWSLFWILARRKDAGWRMGLAYFSQLSYSFALWTWGFGILIFPFLLWFKMSLWQPWMLGLVCICTVWGCAWVYLRKHQVRVIPIGKMGIRAIQLSDLHVSPVMRSIDVHALIEKCMGLNPDVLVLTGDLIMPFSEDSHDFLIDALRKVTVPIIGCLGNHDLPVENVLVKELRDIGVHLLIDSQETLVIRGHRIEWIGLQFQWRDSKGHYERVMSQYSQSTADLRILLAHDPRYFHVVDPSHFKLMLSGHTHGGQFGLNMIGLPVSFFRPLGFIDQGIFRKGNLIAYVHKGNWHTGLPPRVGIAPEIAVFEL